MKKKLTKIIILLILPFGGGFNLGASPPVTFSNKGTVQVAPLCKMYVKGGMHMFPGAAVTQSGLTVLTGDFIHDASGNLFNGINYSGTMPGYVEFRGAEGKQTVTTTNASYDRNTMAIHFPNIRVSNTSTPGTTEENEVVIANNMGVSTKDLNFTGGHLRLKSEPLSQVVSTNPRDASLLVSGAVSGIDNDKHMKIERNVKYNAGRVTDGNPAYSNLRYMGFSAPLANMYLDYFTDHWVFDMRMNGGAGGYDIRRFQRFEPGIGYFVIIRRDPNTTAPGDYIEDGMQIINENFTFKRKYYPDFLDTKWYWNNDYSYVPLADRPQPQEMLNTGNVAISGGLKVGDNYLGNPYTCALNVDALFTAWGTTNIETSMWIWTGQGNTWLTITKDMGTADTRIIPSQQMFVVEGKNAVASFNIPASARTHSSQPFYRSSTPYRNEVLIEVEDAELANFSRMVVGLRSWGKISGDDESDAKFLKNYDETVPQVYAVVPHRDASVPYDTLTINSLPEDTRSTDFDFLPSQVEGNRKYIMKISRQESLQTEIAVLIDRKENVEINLFENDTYEFYADKDDDTQRFTILFAYPTQMEDINTRPRDAYVQKQTLYITNNLESDIRKPVEVYNTSGQLVYRNEINRAGTNTYQLNLAEGVYVVKSSEMVKKIRK